MGPRSPVNPVAAVLLLVLLLMQPVPRAFARSTSDAAWVVDDLVAPDPVEIALRLARLTFHEPVQRVVIATDATFADALASGVLQADGPLLLVPGQAAVPDQVIAELRRMAPQEALILGGIRAVGEHVEGTLGALGIPVTRVAGASRVETAAAIAARVPQAQTALLLREGAGGSADATAGFADALAVGAWAAERAWPILLTAPGALSAETAGHLRASQIERVIVVGGPAAIAPEVDAELTDLGLAVERVYGASRADTALAVAQQRSQEADSTPGSVVLVDGHLPLSWAGGLAAAALAGAAGAPILVSDGPVIPFAYLQSLAASAAQGRVIGLTCIAALEACEAARQALGRSARALVTTDIDDGEPVHPGQLVSINTSGAPADASLLVTGSCLAGPAPLEPAGGIISLADPLPAGSCVIQTSLMADGLVQQEQQIQPVMTQRAAARPSFVPARSLPASLLARTLMADDITILAARAGGGGGAIGLSAGMGEVIGAEHAVVLSTGLVSDLTGPNARRATTTDLGQPGDARLGEIAMVTQGTAITADAAILEIDVVVPRGSTTLSLAYVFGSEEYEEFSDVRGDVLDITINGASCALVGGQHVNAVTVGPTNQAEAYRSNLGSSFDIELDGLTTPLTCTTPTAGARVARIRIAIADVGDALVDSAVMIPAGAIVAS